MTRPSITIEYLANYPELADELAQLSWAEWRSVWLVFQNRRDFFDNSSSGIAI